VPCSSLARKDWAARTEAAREAARQGWAAVKPRLFPLAVESLVAMLVGGSVWMALLFVTRGEPRVWAFVVSAVVGLRASRKLVTWED
jgi:hypothetical protein